MTFRSIGDLAITVMLQIRISAGPLREERGTDPRPRQQIAGAKLVTMRQGTVRPHASCPARIVP